jgi:hypothetical protein
MSPALTPEQDDRWRIRTCARCGRRAAKAANWPDGPICRTCCERAARTYGRCGGCDVDRLLPARGADGTAICRDCAGITRNFCCDRCGVEGPLLGGRLCERCTLTDKLAAALDDGTGRVNPALTPLFDALTSMEKPRSGLNWLRNPPVPELLGALATGRIPLTHEALHTAPSWRTAAYLRDLLMAYGVLPTIDKQLLHYETWLHRRLTDLAGSPHTRLLRQFATWYQLPRLRAKATTRPLTLHVRRYASEQFTQAHGFLGWLQSATAPWPRRPRPTWTPGTPPTATTGGEPSGRSWSGRCAPASSPGWCCRRFRSAGPRRSPSTAGWSCSATSSPRSAARCAPGWPPA